MKKQKRKPKILLYTYHEYNGSKIQSYLHNFGYDIDTIYFEADIDYVNLDEYDFFLIDPKASPILVDNINYEKFSVKSDQVLEHIYKHTMKTDKPAFIIHYVVYDSNSYSKSVKNIKGSKISDRYYGLMPNHMMYSYVLGGITNIYEFMSDHFNSQIFDIEETENEFIVAIHSPGEEDILLILSKNGQR